MFLSGKTVFGKTPSPWSEDFGLENPKAKRQGGPGFLGRPLLVLIWKETPRGNGRVGPKVGGLIFQVPIALIFWGFEKSPQV